jgi:uridine kinase
MVRKPYIVGIGGCSGSGKSSFLRELMDRLPPGQCALVSQDNYYRSIDEQERDAAGEANFDLPGAIHLDQLVADLHQLSRGQPITRKEYTFNHFDGRGQSLAIAPAPVLVLEGLFIFHHAETRDLLDLRVFLDAHEDICKQRRLERDIALRGYSPMEVEYQWTHHVLPAYRKFILPYREQAHCIVVNDDGYEAGLSVVAQHIFAALSRM